MSFTIDKITIENIRGIRQRAFVFNGLCCNKTHILVAPNGFGKTSITTAFHAAQHGKINIKESELYNGQLSNHPRLTIDYTHDREHKTVIADSNGGNISHDFYIFVINNPVYAKPTGRNMGKFSTQSAEEFLEDITLCDVPPSVLICYRISEIRSAIGRQAKKIDSFFNSMEGLSFIINNKSDIDKCIKQIRLYNIWSTINLGNTATSIQSINNNELLNRLFEGLKNSFNLENVDALDYLFQILSTIKREGLKKAIKSFDYLAYKTNKMAIEERLNLFNTTNLDLRLKEHNGKLICSLGKASRMSNGEHDILSFVLRLFEFELKCKQIPGILIIDEIFDYLDGTNLLAAQYYLTEMIARFKNDGKYIFPIIMTHLDPGVFSNYYFKDMRVHYLTNFSHIDLHDKVAMLLLLRSELKANNGDYMDLEKYLLHYNDKKWTVSDTIKHNLPEDFEEDSETFRMFLYSCVINEYLSPTPRDYNALAVLLGLRIRIEELIFEKLPNNKREDFLKKHGSKEKLYFAEECGCDLPDIFYLLQPLYNDVAHLYSGAKNELMNKNKIECASIKLSSTIIKRMIQTVFS